jgi:hypothetical protein
LSISFRYVSLRVGIRFLPRTLYERYSKIARYLAGLNIGKGDAIVDKEDLIHNPLR